MLEKFTFGKRPNTVLGKPALLCGPKAVVTVEAEKGLGKAAEDPRRQLLIDSGLEISWISGDYAGVCRQGKPEYLNWNGQVWVAM